METGKRDTRKSGNKFLKATDEFHVCKLHVDANFLSLGKSYAKLQAVVKICQHSSQAVNSQQCKCNQSDHFTRFWYHGSVASK